MPIPVQTFEPPFNIIRCSYVILGVQDPAGSAIFYTDIIDLHKESQSTDEVFLRGMEELQHHSLILVRVPPPGCIAMGFKVGWEADLDKAAALLARQGLDHKFVSRLHQGRTLHVTDRFGCSIDYYFNMERAERILQKYALYKGVQPQRFEHFNVFVPELQQTMEYYALLGFRLTEYSEEQSADGGRIAATWMQRKGNVHDLAFTNGRGPRLHHFAYFVPTPLNVIHLCDVMATSGYMKNIERGPGRHGISNAFFSMRAIPMVTASKSTAAITRPWTLTIRPCAGRCVTQCVRPCGGHPRRARGLTKAQVLSMGQSAGRCLLRMSSSHIEESTCTS